MRDDIETNVGLIEIVRLNPCLYDQTRSDYSNRNKQDQVWGEIAKKLNDSASICRDRWKNIRGRYVKQMKKPASGSAAKAKKPYYLADYLSFLDTFIASRTPTGNVQSESPEIEEVRSNSEERSNLVQDLSDIDEETSGQDISVFSERAVQNPTFTDRSASSTPEPSASVSSHSDYCSRKKKQTATLNDVNRAAVNYFEEKKKRRISVPSVIDPDEAFLKSILPDMQSMTVAQKRNFEVAVLHLAGQFLNQPVVTPPSILSQYSPISRVTDSSAPNSNQAVVTLPFCSPTRNAASCSSMLTELRQNEVSERDIRAEPQPWNASMFHASQYPPISPVTDSLAPNSNPPVFTLLSCSPATRNAASCSVTLAALRQNEVAERDVQAETQDWNASTFHASQNSPKSPATDSSAPNSNQAIVTPTLCSHTSNAASCSSTLTPLRQNEVSERDVQAETQQWNASMFLPQYSPISSATSPAPNSNQNNGKFRKFYDHIQKY